MNSTPSERAEENVPDYMRFVEELERAGDMTDSFTALFSYVRRLENRIADLEGRSS